MPRLRHYKNFNFNVREFQEPQEELYDNKPTEGTGQHFLNNAFIISTLPEAQIKQAIGYHKLQINLLEAELCGRSSGVRIQSEQLCKETSFSPSDFEAFYSENKPKGNKKKRQTNSRNRGKDKLVNEVVRLLRKAGLTAEELTALLD